MNIIKLILTIISLISSEKFEIFKQDYSIIDKPKKMGFINFGENYLVSNSDIEIDNEVNLDLDKEFIIIFKSEKEEFRTVFSKTRLSKSICIEINLNQENKISNFSLLNNNKIYKEKRKKLKYFIKVNNYSNITESIFENSDDDIKEEEYFEEKENNKNEKNKTEDESFFKKYFWYIVIGGIIIFQLKNFDTSKLKDTINEAKAMQEAKTRDINKNK